MKCDPSGLGVIFLTCYLCLKAAHRLFKFEWASTGSFPFVSALLRRMQGQSLSSDQ
jgi:hypothetical protein